MNRKTDNIDQLITKFNGQWDIYNPDDQHYDRFLEKNRQRNKRVNTWTTFSIAATILILVGFFTFFNQQSITKDQTSDLKYASKQTRETDSIFSALIRIELNKVKGKKSPVSEKMISDALIQMQILDADYEKIKKEFRKNGESKQIIEAMIQNLKTRISFLEEVLKHIENTENLNNQNNENTL